MVTAMQIAPNNTAAGRAQNRRVELTLRALEPDFYPPSWEL